MTLFVSYTKSDDAVVRTIRADLEQLGHDVWMDHQIHGGESWWREIIQEIQGASVFVFALSNSSWKSKPCRLELDYANELGLPVLPLQVGPLDHMYIPLAERQIIDFQNRTADSMVKLVTALTEMVARRVVLPDPLPAPPPVPFEYLYRIASVMGPNRITPERQEELIGTLRRKLREEDDQLARVDIVKLLRELKDRNEITVPNAREVDEILAGATTAPAPEDGSTRLPPADHWRKVEATNGGGAEPPKSVENGAVEASPGSATGSTGSVGETSGSESETVRVAVAEPVAEPEAEAESVSGTAAAGWPSVVSGSTESATDTGPAAEPATGDAGSAQEGGAPAWLADLVRADPGVREPVARQAEPEAAPDGPRQQGSGWWTKPLPVPGGGPSGPQTHETPQVSAQPPAGVPQVERGRRFGPLGVGLGVVGVVFLLVALAGDEDARLPVLAIVALLVGVLGLSVGVVAVTRHEPGARAAAVVAAVGLVGAIGYAAATWT